MPVTDSVSTYFRITAFVVGNEISDTLVPVDELPLCAWASFTGGEGPGPEQAPTPVRMRNGPAININRADVGMPVRSLARRWSSRGCNVRVIGI
jgi:hypothetical protein